jgi:hypothetical protein
MRDDQAQFFIAVADLCAAASLAGVQIEVLTGSGRRISGVPSAAPAARRHGEELDHTGYAGIMVINDVVVDLADIQRCSIFAPDAGDTPQ